jgi:ubiquinone/menaquinone biosynthesis C-methylase UbiE
LPGGATLQQNEVELGYLQGSSKPFEPLKLLISLIRQLTTMRFKASMTPNNNTKPVLNFLDMQGYVGVTKHIGGYEATNELLSLCHIEDAREVLDAGCGIGVGPAYLAGKFNCRVVGIDASEKMIEWARRRAREEGIEDKVEFHAADILRLPFEDDRFDAVICESVLAFVEDKQRAIREFVRVTKPGGYVGLNEGFWIKQPPSEIIKRVKDALGPSILTLEAWQTLWEASGLEKRVVITHQIEARAEIKSRLQWIGWRWILRAWGRALRLYITNPAIRHSIKKQFEVPTEAFQYVGYGLFVGRKQTPDSRLHSAPVS